MNALIQRFDLKYFYSVTSSKKMEEFDELQSIGFMFDRSHRRSQRNFVFNNGDMVIHITSIGSDPGHVQSGQYLWPAAEFACEHLIKNWDILFSHYIIELGAGCGLTGHINDH